MSSLKIILDKVRDLDDLFSVKYSVYINKIIKSELHPDKLKDDENAYLNKISTFLASKIPTIKHVNKYYEIKNIDMLRKEIRTAEAKIIKFNDLGTGQGQGAYLEGLLSLNDNRKLIVLFDEIAMMDNSTLEPIFNRLRRMYLKGQVLIALIVQRAEAPKVIELI
jgi:hypothetical protein